MSLDKPQSWPDAAPKPAFSPDSRERNLERLRSEPFDFLIVGGGINGAGVARDLALRSQRSGIPLRVALIEQRHFASGTSGKNSQLLHGGLRYLKQLEFRLVRESLRERGVLLALAPHLAEPLSFLIPFYSRTDAMFYGSGLWLYHFLAGKRSRGRPRFLTPRELARLEPGLARQNLVGGGIYEDGRVHSARFLLENIFDAARWGAVIANYTRADDVTGSGAMATEVFSGDRFFIRARKIIDATGPWESAEPLRLVRGSHIVVSRLNASNHAIAFFEETGRIVFVIPWGSRLQFSLVGTTDCDHTQGPDCVAISPGEVQYLLNILRRIYPTAERVEPIAAFSSLRPLVGGGEESASETSREHRIWNSSDGVLHIAGGKYTTYRLMSEQAADQCLREVAPELVGRCFTTETPLGGNTAQSFQSLMEDAPVLAAGMGLEPEEARVTVREYGLQAGTLLSLVPPSGPDRLLRARIAFAVRHEMARRLADFLFVSSYIGYERSWTPEDLMPLAHEMGSHLGWNHARVEEEVRLALTVCLAA